MKYSEVRLQEGGGTPPPSVFALLALGAVVLVLSLSVLLVLGALLLFVLSILLFVLIFHDEAHLTSGHSMPRGGAAMQNAAIFKKMIPIPAAI